MPDDIKQNIGYINRAIQDIDTRITNIEKRINHTIPTRAIWTFWGILTTGIFFWLSALTTIIIKAR